MDAFDSGGVGAAFDSENASKVTMIHGTTVGTLSL